MIRTMRHPRLIAVVGLACIVIARPAGAVPQRALTLHEDIDVTLRVNGEAFVRLPVGTAAKLAVKVYAKETPRGSTYIYFRRKGAATNEKLWRCTSYYQRYGTNGWAFDEPCDYSLSSDHEQTLYLQAFVGRGLDSELSADVVKRTVLARSAVVTVTWYEPTPHSIPDITGTWRNPKDSSNAPWALHVNGDTLTGSWSGGSGHTRLHGTFEANLDRRPGAASYSGSLHIVEGSLNVNGNITVKIVSKDELEVSYHQSNGPGGTFTLDRS